MYTATIVRMVAVGECRLFNQNRRVNQMKATINGVTYEGTFEEITAIVDRMTSRLEQQPNLKPLDHSGGWWGIYAPRIYSGDPPASTSIGGSTTSRIIGCPASGGSCFCTGACQGKESAAGTFMYSKEIMI